MRPAKFPANLEKTEMGIQKKAKEEVALQVMRQRKGVGCVHSPCVVRRVLIMTRGMHRLGAATVAIEQKRLSGGGDQTERERSAMHVDCVCVLQGRTSSLPQTLTST